MGAHKAVFSFPDVILEGRSRPPDWEDAIQGRIVREYAHLAPHFKRINCECVLDIGCGLGCMDVLLARRHGTKMIHLLDGDGTGPKKNKYNTEVTVPWNDVTDAAIFVAHNTEGLDPRPSVMAHRVGERRKMVIVPPPTLIMSLWSWGFHYPVSAYLELAKHYPDALVLIDLRNSGRARGLEEMQEAGYRVFLEVHNESKARRIIFKL